MKRADRENGVDAHAPLTCRTGFEGAIGVSKRARLSASALFVLTDTLP